MKGDIDDCLSAQQLASYVNGDLRDDEKARIGRHLDECRLCAGAVEGVTRVGSAQTYLNSADSVRTRLRLRAASGAASGGRTSRVWAARSYMALAATLVVVSGLISYLARPGADETLFRQYFDPYPGNQPVVRGAATDAPSQAMLLYQSRDYRGALAGYEDLLRQRPNDPAARFYAGLCQLALGRSADAIAHFEEVKKAGAGEFERPAEWYLALAYLRNRDVEQARARLTAIAAGGGFYADNARALLRALDAR
jgi:tetratricopeptide (TPR) repeat protein